MRLIEATSKELLARYGLQAPAGRLCTSADEARAAAEELGTKVYVKAQIPFGDRATHGLVVAANDPDAAARETESLLGRVVEGLEVTSVIVEAAAEPEESAYISTHVDDEAGARILRVGIGGGA